MTALLTQQTLDAQGQHRPLRRGTVSASDIRKYCVATDDRNPLYLDREAARAAGFADVIAPPLFAHAAMRPTPFQSDLLGDGQLPDLAPPGLTHLQSLLAGQDWEFVRPVTAGEELVEDTWYGKIEERTGKSGPMVFVTEESLISTKEGEAVLRSSNHLIFREPPPPAPPHEGDAPAPASGPATEWQDGRLIKRPSMVGLFMFAATIWATHRLHWDAAQAKREGLPGPVLPGWMAASYLTEFTQGIGPVGKRIIGLSLRYRSFAFPGDELTCEGTLSDANIQVSLTNQYGTEVQSGLARFA